MANSKTRITGSGILGGGVYNDISISGSGKISGDIKCDKLSVSGSCKSEGMIEAENISVNGSFKTEKSIKTKSLSANGAIVVEGDIKTDNFYVNGSVKTDNTNVYAEYLEVNGSLSNEKELNADRVVVNGRIKANEIVGTTIEILKNAHSLDISRFFRFTSRGALLNKAETITCEKIEARCLRCNKICADNIILKRDCTVDYVECNGRLFIGRTCKVGNIEGDCEIIRE